MVPRRCILKLLVILSFSAIIRLTFMVLSETIGLIAMKLGTDIQVPIRMNCNNFGESLTKAIVRSYYFVNTYKTNDFLISLSCTCVFSANVNITC